MVTKRVPINRVIRTQITPQVVAQFIIASEIVDTGDQDEWEEEGGRAAEYRDLKLAIDKALGREPWQLSPLDVEPDGEPTPDDLSHPGRDFAGARELRIALEQAASRLNT